MEQYGLQSTPLVRLCGASVTRGGARLLADIDFRLTAGARLAVLGQNGAGKTTFLRLLRGDILPDAPRPDASTHATAGQAVRAYHFPGQDEQATPLGLRQLLALVSGDMQDLYARHEWAITAEEAVLTGFFDTPLLYAEPTQAQRTAAHSALEALGLSHLAQRRMAELSSGQARAVLLARALACKPAALLLDECLEGLDTPARRIFMDALDCAAAADPALAVLFCSHRTDELPICLNGALLLCAGRICAQGTLAEIQVASTTAPEPARPASQSPTPPPLQVSQPLVLNAGQKFLARISRADVVMNGAHLLHGIDWTLRPGEHWAVLGKNGAGKSTLLSLLAGEFWPSALMGEPGRVEYGFAAREETLDDTRKRLGRVSAAFDRDYGWDLRVDETVWSGALGSIGLYAEAGTVAKTRAQALMDFFGVAHLAGRRLSSLSRGQLRRVMLARAMLGYRGEGPALLLLDEPMAGLDTRARRAARELLGRVAAGGTPLVMVTHHERDLPEQINRVLVMDEGKVAFCGEREAFRQWRPTRIGWAARTGKI